MEKVVIGSELEQEFVDRIFDRIYKIPIMNTLKLEVTDIKAGYCELKAPRQKIYDGIFDSFHGGLLFVTWYRDRKIVYTQSKHEW